MKRGVLFPLIMRSLSFMLRNGRCLTWDGFDWCPVSRQSRGEVIDARRRA